MGYDLGVSFCLVIYLELGIILVILLNKEVGFEKLMIEIERVF